MPIHKKLTGRASITLFAIILLLVLGGLSFTIFKKKEHVSSFNGNPIVFYNIETKVSELSTIESQGQKLPSELIIKPGIYEVYGKTYNLENEGLYRFLLPPKENQQRIVFNGNIDALISSISWIYSHGTEDNQLTFKKLKEKALKEKLVGTCGYISNFAKNLLTEQGIESRIVSGITSEDFNGYDDSHVMIEVKKDGIWQVYDLDNNSVFYKDGKPLNFYDFVKEVPNGNYEIKKLSSDIQVAVSGFKDTQTDYNYSFYGEERYNTEESLRQWYKRVLSVSFIKDGNISYYFSGDEEKVKSFNPNTEKISEDEFIKKFYQ